LKLRVVKISKPAADAGRARAPVLAVRGVGKTLGGQKVVRGATLEIAAGEFFSLLGPSGCGKTTLLRLIAGFERPDEGEIVFPGAPGDGRPAYARDLNLVFQHYALFPHMTVAGNVGFGLEMQRVPRGERERRVAEALQLVRLAALGERYPRQLSGGQQQRVALARAIVTRPSVLLLDEPLGALDLKLRREMQEELKGLQRRLGITFVYVTHDQEEALVMSDRIAVMHHGRVLQVGTPAEIYDRPATRFVADFIGESNFLEGRIGAPAAAYALVSVGGIDMKIHAPEDAARGEPAMLAIRPEKIQLSRRRQPSRDNVFPAIVEGVVYLGTDTRYRVRLGEGLALTVRLQNQADNAFQVGDRVYASWPAGAVSRVAPDSGA
jgi:spermidine/putrescine transport system ATP-binding protein